MMARLDTWVAKTRQLLQLERGEEVASTTQRDLRLPASVCAPRICTRAQRSDLFAP